jgi:hypothetical protein
VHSRFHLLSMLCQLGPNRLIVQLVPI